MALTKYYVGELIQTVDERNSACYRNFFGININKEFMPTAANTDGLDESKYKVVRKNRFVFSGMQTGRDNCIRISMYTGDKPIIVSPAYITFEVSRPDVILPMYFFLLFLSKEKDRLGAFYSDGSIRSNLDWDRFCEIELMLPPLLIQQKYVAVYKAMVANQQSYERGLEDLKLACDGYIENLKKTTPCVRLGLYITQKNIRNSDKQNDFVVGLSTKKEFREAQSRVNKNELGNYKIVKPNEFAFVPTTDTWKVLAFALNKYKKNVVVSPIYEVFAVNTDKIVPEYLSIWLSRKEFDRYARYNSWGSARENFSFEEMCNVELPVPDLRIQEAIADLYSVYIRRKKMNEELKEQVKGICPILIKGSINDARKEV